MKKYFVFLALALLPLLTFAGQKNVPDNNALLLRPTINVKGAGMDRLQDEDIFRVEDAYGTPIFRIQANGSVSGLGSGTGDMITSNNLSDLANKATSRTNLGVALGTDVEAYDSDLAALAAVSTSNAFYYRFGPGDWRAVAIGTNLTFSGGTLSATGGGGGGAWGSITGTLSGQTDLQAALDAKQAVLVSTTNIKSVNGNSLLGSGNISISGSVDLDALGSAVGTDIGSTDLFMVSDGGTEKSITAAEFQNWLQSLSLTFSSLSVTNFSFSGSFTGTVPDANIASTIARDSEVAAVISDTAFASSWNAVTGVAPSKNAVYDWAHIFDTDDDGKVNVLDVAAAGFPITDASGVVSTPRTITGTSNEITVTNGDGQSGNPTISLPTRISAAANNVVFLLTIDAVADSMNYTIGYVPAAFTITELRFVHNGTTSSPSITPTVKHGTDRSSGTAVVTSPSAVTSTTTGASVTSFNSATTSANAWLWVETASKSGTTDRFTIAVVGHY